MSKLRLISDVDFPMSNLRLYCCCWFVLLIHIQSCCESFGLHCGVQVLKGDLIVRGHGLFQGRKRRLPMAQISEYDDERDRSDEIPGIKECRPPGCSAPPDEELLYVVGATLASQTIDLMNTFTSLEERAFIIKGFSDTYMNKELKHDLLDAVKNYPREIQEFIQKRSVEVASERAVNGLAALRKAAEEPGAVTTSSGLVFRHIIEGKGPNPGPTDRVSVFYHGTLSDGTTFDTTKDFDGPIRFLLNDVILGWSEGIQQMRKGGKMKLTIPPDIGYGSQTLGSIPPGSTLIFEIELVDVEKRVPSS